MKLTLNRKWKTKKSTIGELFVDGKFECYTLEDFVRKPGEAKVYGETAIPSGIYRVVVDFSNRFQRRMPHVLDVPNFTGIRIHAGLNPSHTLGCILVGDTLGDPNNPDDIGGSQAAYKRLFAKLDNATDIKLEVV